MTMHYHPEPGGWDADYILTVYLETALWSSVHYADENSDGVLMDEIVDVDDVSDELRAESLADLRGFMESEALDLAFIDPEQIAHDLWLTRNHHGAGFWDRGYPFGIGDRLTTAAHAYGSVDLYIGDDGKVYA